MKVLVDDVYVLKLPNPEVNTVVSLFSGHPWGMKTLAIYIRGVVNIYKGSQKSVAS